MKTMILCGLLLVGATACAVEATATAPLDPVVETDSAAMVPGPDAAPSAMPDAHPATADTGHSDALPPRGEAGADGGLPSAVDGAAASQDGARTDGGTTGDGAVSPTDARGTDGGVAADASARERAIAEIEATYAGQPCGMFDGPYCGAVVENGIVFVYPLACLGASSRTAIDGHWTLGSSSNQCNRPCQTPGQLCAP